MSAKNLNSTAAPPEVHLNLTLPSASVDPILEACLSFLVHDWFGAALKGTERLTLTALILTLAAEQGRGMLTSKKAAMRAIGAEHVSTLKRYTDLATQMGLVKIEKAKADRRVELLILTELGQKLVATELTKMQDLMQWAIHTKSKSLPPDTVPNAPDALSFPTAPRSSFLAEQIAAIDFDAEPATFAPQMKRRLIVVYTETLRVFPKHEAALRGRAETYSELGDFVAAIRDYTILVELDRRKYLNQLAIAHYHAKNYTDAITEATEACALEPDNTENTFALLLALVGAERYDDALRAADTALSTISAKSGDESARSALESMRAHAQRKLAERPN